jgi:malonate decarboxylase beta subunit
MERLHFTLKAARVARGSGRASSESSASGNLEVLIEPQARGIGSAPIDVDTGRRRFRHDVGGRSCATSSSVIRCRTCEFPINDAGADSPAIVACGSIRRVGSARMIGGSVLMHSYYEKSARERIDAVVDAGSFREILPPQARMLSPHPAGARSSGRIRRRRDHGRGHAGGLPILDRGAGRRIHGRRGRASATAPSSSACCSGAVHDELAGVVLLLESGGCSLQEANAGLIAVSEVIRAILASRAAGVPGRRRHRRAVRVLRRHGHRGRVLHGDRHVGRRPAGPFGAGSDRDGARGRGIRFARPCARMAHRRRQASISCSATRQRWSTIPSTPSAARLPGAIRAGDRLDLDALEREQELLDARLATFRQCTDGEDDLATPGWPEPDRVPLLTATEFVAQARERRVR